MSHALAAAGAVLALPSGVIRPALGARLVSAARESKLLPPRRRPARDGAVAVAAIAPTTDLEIRAAARAATVPKLLHPTSRAEEVSTGDPSPIIIPSETKRLHPRGDSVAAESPVSSTSDRESQAATSPEPVSGRARIPRTPAVATIVSPRSAAIVSKHRVCIDGFEEEGPGSNVDPNVLAERLPWFLSYCNVGKSVIDLGADGREVGPFPDVVRRGDIVIFGDPHWADSLAVDTVIRAHERILMPTLGGVFAVEKQFTTYWKRCVDAGLADSITWGDFARTRDFVLNLADCMPAPRRGADSPRAAEVLGHRRQTWHPKPTVPAHQQLVGTRCRVFEPTTVEAVRELFAASRGFDFIPLGAGVRPSSALVARRPGLFTVPFAGAAKLQGASVFRLARAEGLALLRDILGTADRLVVGPLRWVKARRFSHFEASRRPSKVNPTKELDEIGPRYVRVPEGHTI
jgi:hypothetical protein